MPHAFTRLLLATEHSEHDVGAETLAFALARRCSLPLAAVLPILSNPEYETLAPQLAAHAEAQAGVRLQALQADAQRAGVALEVQARRGPEPWVEIVEEARRLASDLIVIRRRGRRGLLANLLVGEMVRNVVAHAPCSVLVVPRAAAMWQRRVLVSLDPTSPDMTPVSTAAAIAAECGLPLSVLAVAGPAAEAMQHAERALQQAWSAARGFGVAVDAATRVGRPHEQVVAGAKQLGADLLVIGRHGSDSLAHAWLGGVAQKVIGLAEQPVLVCITPSPSSTGPRT
ncbi:MAG: universal stress protein [Piscinibacter sp.]|uniref:universal stress protein n=1 Tax=Piscinibacter TaxID=1114981 RepID=UPI000FDCEB93|nr:MULTISPECIES: universal stress protein [Piscinibacter]MCW5665908.1 universal stress protein [Piscinibacter sp.]